MLYQLHVCFVQILIVKVSFGYEKLFYFPSWKKVCKTLMWVFLTLFFNTLSHYIFCPGKDY